MAKLGFKFRSILLQSPHISPIPLCWVNKKNGKDTKAFTVADALGALTISPKQWPLNSEGYLLRILVGILSGHESSDKLHVLQS